MNRIMASMSLKSLKKIVKKNTVLIMGVSLIIGVHWGWWKIQQNPALVDLKDRKELPVYTVYKHLKAKILGDNVVTTGSTNED